MIARAEVFMLKRMSADLSMSDDLGQLPSYSCSCSGVVSHAWWERYLLR